MPSINSLMKSTVNDLILKLQSEIEIIETKAANDAYSESAKIVEQHFCEYSKEVAEAHKMSGDVYNESCFDHLAQEIRKKIKPRFTKEQISGAYNTND